MMRGIPWRSKARYDFIMKRVAFIRWGDSLFFFTTIVQMWKKLIQIIPTETVHFEFGLLGRMCRLPSNMPNVTISVRVPTAPVIILESM